MPKDAKGVVIERHPLFMEMLPICVGFFKLNYRKATPNAKILSLLMKFFELTYEISKNSFFRIILSTFSKLKSFEYRYLQIKNTFETDL